MVLNPGPMDWESSTLTTRPLLQVEPKKEKGRMMSDVGFKGPDLSWKSLFSNDLLVSFL